jgi:copper transport protein
MLDLLAAVLKALGYIAALGGAGTVLARATLLRGASVAVPPTTGPIRAAGFATVLLTCATALLFVERLGGVRDPAAVEAVVSSPLGTALALQTAGGLWLAVATYRPLAPLGALLILVAFGVVGHSATRGGLTAVTVVVHVAAAAWWLGGLLLLFRASRRSGDADYIRLVARFSRQAAWIVALLIAAAATTAALLLEFRFDPDRSYDVGLLAKAGLTSALLGLAAVNRLILLPRLAAGAGARIWLRRTLLAEMLFFILVFGTTAWLTSFQSPHVPAHPAHQAGSGAGHIITPVHGSVNPVEGHAVIDRHAVEPGSRAGKQRQ